MSNVNRGKSIQEGFAAAKVVCPYWRGDGSRPIRIRCEGYGRGMTVELCFKTNKMRDEHHKQYCDRYNYQQCCIAKATDKRYQEREG